jgi:hypothetical protein
MSLVLGELKTAVPREKDDEKSNPRYTGRSYENEGCSFKRGKDSEDEKRGQIRSERRPDAAA